MGARKNRGGGGDQDTGEERTGNGRRCKIRETAGLDLMVVRFHDMC